MTDSAESTGAPASAPPPIPYDPKTLFLEEWRKHMPADLASSSDELNPGKMWDIVVEHTRETAGPPGRILSVIPEEIYRWSARAACLTWVSNEYRHRARRAKADADALAQLVRSAVGEPTGDKCTIVDMPTGYVRECVHSPDEIAKSIASGFGGKLMDALKGALGVT